jgi:hydroxymethylbilane synthase
VTLIRIGSRGSTLATAQTQWVADRLRAALSVEVELVPVVSDGDRTSAPLSQIGGTGVFVGAVRQALAAGDADVAVHSLKDLPTTTDDRVILAAVPPREDPRDALIARDDLTLGELPAGATVGTGSPRRAAQLRALGLGLDIVDIRGNVETRIKKVTSGQLDAVVLARAGLNRVGLADLVTETLDPLLMLPAPGQGALAVEVAIGNDSLAKEIASVLDDPATRAAVDAERALLAALEAGCTAPVGALADVADGDDGPELWLRAVVAALDGRRVVRRSATGDPAAAAEVGRGLAAQLLSEGAAELVEVTVP